MGLVKPDPGRASTKKTIGDINVEPHVL
jgi:hypothetical protein